LDQIESSLTMRSGILGIKGSLPKLMIELDSRSLHQVFSDA